MEKIIQNKTNFKRNDKNAKRITTNVQLQQLAKRMHIPYFRDIFMRTTLPTGEVYRNKSGIVNLGNFEQVLIGWRMRSGIVMFTLTISAIFDR